MLSSVPELKPMQVSKLLLQLLQMVQHFMVKIAAFFWVIGSSFIAPGVYIAAITDGGAGLGSLGDIIGDRGQSAETIVRLEYFVTNDISVYLLDNFWKLFRRE